LKTPIITVSWPSAEILSKRWLNGVDVEIATYESLSEPFLEKWLPRIRLPYIPGELSLPGQVAPGEICNQSAQHYQ
jgi:hypothetical protein